MYAKIILAAQIVLLALAAEARLLSVRMEWNDSTSSPTTEISASNPHRPGVVDAKALRQYVVRNVAQIKKVAATTHLTATQKLEYIKKIAEAVAAYRSVNWSRSAYTEYDLDLMIKPYESFPEPRRFLAQNCYRYQNRIITDWDPLAQDQRPSERGVSEALGVLKTICQ
jgi:hypothetical protein